MTLKGDERRYGSLAAAFHWGSAAAILALLAIGFAAANTTDPVRTAALLRVHVPLGVLVVLLTLARLVWRRFDRRPAPPAGQPAWQRRAAGFNHAALYGLVLLMGVSGIATMIVSGAGATLFGGVAGTLPRFAAFPPMAAHALGAIMLVGLLACHVGAVVYHQFYRHDRLAARMRLGAVTPHRRHPESRGPVRASLPPLG